MIASLRKLTALIVLLALLGNAYAFNVSASVISPHCAMMAQASDMVDNDSSLDMNCDCDHDQMHNCCSCVDVIHASSIVLNSATRLIHASRASATVIGSPPPFDSITTKLISPPPIA